MNSETNDEGNARETMRRPRPKKLMSRVNIWIRRIHLFSGLFMLPWVLLYGMTALLFNHPNVLVGPDTEVAYFKLSENAAGFLPAANELAEKAIENAASILDAAESSQTIELASPLNASFSRQASGSIGNEQYEARLVVDFETGKGYLRKRGKTSEPEKPDRDKPTLESKVNLTLKSDPVGRFKSSVAETLKSHDFDSEKVRLRSLPPVEFDAIVDGQLMRMKLVQRSSDRARSVQDAEKKKETDEPEFDATLSIVGQHPRDMNTRSFLLRLHMAHGYPSRANVRWFWAIAVDMMFASMVFWGLSGVVMWWQIKRTRRIGFVILAASAVAATWLAIGMHWQLVNG